MRKHHTCPERKKRGPPSEKGSSFILMVIALPALLGAAGLVLDWGRGAWIQTRLQNAADAGALAGASMLPSSSAADAKAREMVTLNFNSPDQVSVTSQNNRLTVELSEDVPTFFMSIFGHDNMPVSVSATAKALRPVSGLRGGGFPFALIDPNLNNDPGDDLMPSNYGRVYIIGYGEDNVMVEDWANGTLPPPSSPGQGAQGGGGNSQGWRAALGMRADGTLGNSGANDLRYCMEHGWSGILMIGDLVPIKTGNMAGPTRDGREARLGTNPLPWPEFDPRIDYDSNRVVLVPVVHLINENRGDTYTVQDWWNGAAWDHDNVVVEGFAPFFILTESEYVQYLGAQGNPQDWVFGYYIPGTETSNFLPPDEQTSDYGLRCPPRLVD